MTGQLESHLPPESCFISHASPNNAGDSAIRRLLGNGFGVMGHHKSRQDPCKVQEIVQRGPEEAITCRVCDWLSAPNTAIPATHGKI
jgi:hypothetical protein